MLLYNYCHIISDVIEQHSPSPDLTTDTESDVTVDPTYFKEFSFYPSLVVKIDYEAKRFDMDKVCINNCITIDLLVHM